MAEPSDKQAEQWVADVAAGGPAALKSLGLLFHAYQQPLLRFLGKGSLMLTAHDADDVMQQFWIKLPKIAHKFQPGRARVISWLLGVLSFDVLNHKRQLFRRTSREQPLEQLEDGDAAEKSADDQDLMGRLAAMSLPSPQEAAEVAELQRCVRTQYAAFKRERPRHARLLYLWYHFGMDTPELAAFRFAECSSLYCKFGGCAIERCESATPGATRSYLSDARAFVKSFLERCR